MPVLDILHVGHPVLRERSRELTREETARRARRLAERKANSMPTVKKLDRPVKVRKVHAPLVSPVPDGGVIGVVREPYLLRLLVRRELAKLYSASLLGLFWSYVQPAMRFGVYYLIFGFILKLHQGFTSFAIHLFCGIVFVHLFTETWSGGTRSIRQNRALALTDPGTVQFVRGGLTLIQGNKVSGYDLGNDYEVGHLPWWFALRRWFSLHPYLIWPCALLLMAVLGFVLKGVLRRRAQRRLAHQA